MEEITPQYYTHVRSLKMYEEGLDKSVDKRLNLSTDKPDLDKWKNMLKLK